MSLKGGKLPVRCARRRGGTELSILGEVGGERKGGFGMSGEPKQTFIVESRSVAFAESDKTVTGNVHHVFAATPEDYR